MSVLTQRKYLSLSFNSQAIKLELYRLLLLVVGVILGVISFVLFQIPHNISWGGTTGISLIVNHYTGLSHGLGYWLLSSPMIVLGYYTLGGWRFVYKSLLVATLYAILTDLLLAILPTAMSSWPLTDNLMLSTVYGGIIGGISGGLIFLSGTAYPGTSVISRLINKRTGLPISFSYMVIDGSIIAGMGLVFGWEASLYGILMLIIGGMVTDYTMEGPSTTRTVTVVTEHPQAVATSLMATLNKGVSYWEVTGAYSGQTRTMLTTTIFRSQVVDVKDAIVSADSHAFVTIGISHHALGEGFKPLNS